MKRTIGRNTKVEHDQNSIMISVDWDCPNCGEYNTGLYFAKNPEGITGDFEIDQVCDECGEKVTIECRNAKPLF